MYWNSKYFNLQTVFLIPNKSFYWVRQEVFSSFQPSFSPLDVKKSYKKKAFKQEKSIKSLHLRGRFIK